MRLLLRVHPDYVAIKLDAKNAFNSISRSCMLQQLHENFPGLHHFFNNTYRSFQKGDEGPRILFGCKDGKVRVIWSRQGTTQGDPGGPMLFALGLHPALEALQRELGSEAYILASLDDIIILLIQSIQI